jgi:hypothetical protein
METTSDDEKMVLVLHELRSSLSGKAKSVRTLPMDEI